MECKNMLRKIHLVLTVTLVLGLILTTAFSLMAANKDVDVGPGVMAAGDVIGGVKAKGGARLLVFIGPSEPGYVIRSKGVAEVTHPATGDWCIKPKSNWKVGEVVPTVSVEWSNSSGSSLLAYWRFDGMGCPEGNIEVYTLDSNSGTPVMSDNVAFTVVIP
jgi:hypothetical protein